MVAPKPFAPAAERNKQAILSALQKVLRADDTVLEIGSGTGQHACHIAAAMPQLTWQPSDLEDNLAVIRQWVSESGCNNILPPVPIDLNESDQPAYKASVCFSANTLHIVRWTLVDNLFKLSAASLSHGGKLCVYGPFSFGGQHISDSNQQFDRQLRNSDPDSGIRDIEDLQQLALEYGFSDADVFTMPANNHLLVWTREPG
ncbi:MAG: DUF938 domain-containing protein [Granulosicoccus sp.]